MHVSVDDFNYFNNDVNLVSTDVKLWQLKGQYTQKLKFCYYFL